MKSIHNSHNYCYFEYNGYNGRYFENNGKNICRRFFNFKIPNPTPPHPPPYVELLETARASQAFFFFF